MSPGLSTFPMVSLARISGIKSGLVEALQLLNGVEGISIIRFKDIDVVRHPLVGRIVRAYDSTYAAQAEEGAPQI